MILTGDEIRRQVARRGILIEPFHDENVNPNSYNFSLAPILRVYDTDVLDAKVPAPTLELLIGPDGFVLQPGRLYLASTIERMGSPEYVPTYAARSSVARLGMFINLSAPLGDIGFFGNWTIQLYCLHQVRVYAGMKIGQMMFWRTTGDILLYQGKYQGSSGPCASLIHRDFAPYSVDLNAEATPGPLPAPVQ